jgi:acyl transferase domain-containing protein
MALSYYRGQAMRQSTAPRGGMATVGMSPERAKRYLPEGVTVACENSPQSVTLSGDDRILTQVVEQIHAEEPDMFCRRLDVSVAYHSGKLTTVY